jgi:hypothetical protein
VAAAEPTLQLVDATEVAFTSPAGYKSVKSAERVAETNACVLVIVMVSKAVPPAGIVLKEKLFEILGLESNTVSISPAEQTPPVHDPVTFVLVTLEGGVIVAMLLTCV